jgi:hypothetical protein
VGDRFIVTTGEHSGGLVGTHGVLQRESDPGPGFAGGTTADGIDHHHHGAAAGSEDAVHFFGSARFLDPKAGQVRRMGIRNRSGYATL